MGFYDPYPLSRRNEASSNILVTNQNGGPMELGDLGQRRTLLAGTVRYWLAPNDIV